LARLEIITIKRTTLNQNIIKVDPYRQKPVVTNDGDDLTWNLTNFAKNYGKT